MPNRIYILQAQIITVVAFHLGVFQGIVIFFGGALWLRSIEEANDKFYQRYPPTNLVGLSQIL
jgi:hypothetical protein